MKIARISILILIAIAMLTSTLARAACRPGQLAVLAKPTELNRKNEDGTFSKVVVPMGSQVHVIGVNGDEVEVYALETAIGSAIGTLKTNPEHHTLSCQ